jgi:dipeptidyl-peptidase 4
VAFNQANNLIIKDLASGNIKKVTTDGQWNSVINGMADWVYEEEFSIVKMFAWSPDGTKIGWIRFDESAVPEFTMQYFKGANYPKPYSFKYPKVGEKNALVSAHIFDLNSGQTLDLATGLNVEDYLPRLAWTPTAPSKLCLTTLNRHQNDLRLLLADAETGAISTLFEEKNAWYVDLSDDFRFLKDGSGFVWSSEKSGTRQLYLHDMNGRQTRQLTKGKAEVTNFYGLDEKNGVLFYQTVGNSPMTRDLFSVKINGKGQKKLSKNEGWHDAQFSSTFDFFVKNFSTANSPAAWAVFDRKGNGIRVIEDNAILAEKQVEFGVQPVEFFSFKTSENVGLNGWMIKPPAEKMGGKHPVLMFVYGGPGNQQVTDQWKGANYWWFQLLAQKGFVVACVDNRGTGGRGEKFKKMTYLQLGHFETLDQIEAAKYLQKLPFVDPARIGIFGWSYGGFMASSCLFKGAGTFKTAISVAPVTNWKWYDSIYTERYMRTHAENEAGYEENSPINFAEKMEGNFLLVHGEADDNVHFQHTAELTNRLISSGKHFDTMLYPNRNHGIGGGGARLHLYTKMTDFLMEKL